MSHDQLNPKVPHEVHRASASKEHLSRRLFLRSSLVALPLPWLLPQVEAREQHRRLSTGFIFLPNGVVKEGWDGKANHLPNNNTPQERSIQLGTSLASLAPYKSSCTRIENLGMLAATAGNDGTGDHARSGGTFLTGQRALKTDMPPLRVGISIDQVIAQSLGQAYSLPSLNLSPRASSRSGNCDSGYHCSYMENISWRNAQTPTPNLVDPSDIFLKLFGIHPKSSKRELEQLWAHKQSLLDSMVNELRHFKYRATSQDQSLLDDYTTSIRELERELQITRQRKIIQPSLELPEWGPRSDREHRRLLLRLMGLSFRYDLSPVATMMMDKAGSNSVYRDLNLQEGHHSLSHHGQDPAKIAQLKKIDQYLMEDISILCEELQRDLSDSWQGLQQCQILIGSCIDDGQRHNHDNLPILLLGEANDKWKGGRHLRSRKNTPLAEVYLSMLSNLGIPQKSFADATQPLEGLNG